MSINKRFYELGYTIESKNRVYIVKNEKINHEVVGFKLDQMLKYILSTLN